MAGMNGVAAVVAIALVGGLLTVAVPSKSRADAVAVEPIKASLRLPKSHSARTVKFDWLAKRGPTKSVMLVSAEPTSRQLGKGSWICSPAGFGKKSRCYAN
jgi:hypothetical protein